MLAVTQLALIRLIELLSFWSSIFPLASLARMACSPKLT